MFKKIIVAYILRLKRDDLSTYAAQIAFFSILSILPFLVLISMWLSNSGILNLDAIVAILEDQVSLSPELASTFENVLKGLDGNIAIGSFSTITVLWSSSRMIRAIMAGIHMSYRERDNRPIVVRYLLSVLYTILISFSIVLFLIMVVYGQHIEAVLIGLGVHSVFLSIVWKLSRFLIPLVLIFGIFWSLFRLLPARRVRFSDTFPGAVFSIILIFVLSLLFMIFINVSKDSSYIYGGLSNVVLVMSWFYFFGYALIMGMELNAVIYENPEYQQYFREKGENFRSARLQRKQQKLEKRKLQLQQKQNRTVSSPDASDGTMQPPLQKGNAS